MSTTLIAVFDEQNEAREACGKLQAAGIDEQSIQLNGSPAPQPSQPSDAPMDARHDRDDEPGTISRFFSELFGTDQDAPEGKNYSDAVRQGQFVLSVTVDDEDRVDEISDILDDCGAVDVDERAHKGMAAAAVPERPAASESADFGDRRR